MEHRLNSHSITCVHNLSIIFATYSQNNGVCNVGLCVQLRSTVIVVIAIGMLAKIVIWRL